MEKKESTGLQKGGKLVAEFEHLLKQEGLTSDAICLFQKIIYHYYGEHSRQFPWRETRNSYAILLSEVMLQQTQTERVIEKYEQFLKAFPGFSFLARASLGEILSVWQGLGYNRRAIALKEIAERVVTEYDGGLPSEAHVLMTFPGIGKATASAISAFVFNRPAVFIETNIRRVFIHFFFHNENHIADAQILPLIEKTLDASNPREWYYALMDYGAMLKASLPNPNRRSAHYQKQSPFKGSDRQIRGRILKALLAQSSLSEAAIMKRAGASPERVRKNLMQLQKEGFIKKKGEGFTLV